MRNRIEGGPRPYKGPQEEDTNDKNKQEPGEEAEVRRPPWDTSHPDNW